MLKDGVLINDSSIKGCLSNVVEQGTQRLPEGDYVLQEYITGVPLLLIRVDRNIIYLKERVGNSFRVRYEIRGYSSGVDFAACWQGVNYDHCLGRSWFELGVMFLLRRFNVASFAELLEKHNIKTDFRCLAEKRAYGDLWRKILTLGFRVPNDFEERIRSFRYIPSEMALDFKSGYYVYPIREVFDVINGFAVKIANKSVEMYIRRIDDGINFDRPVLTLSMIDNCAVMNYYGCDQCFRRDHSITRYVNEVKFCIYIFLRMFKVYDLNELYRYHQLRIEVRVDLNKTEYEIGLIKGILSSDLSVAGEFIKKLRRLEEITI